MKIKRFTTIELIRRLRYLQKTRPDSRWIKYIKYHLKDVPSALLIKMGVAL